LISIPSIFERRRVLEVSIVQADGTNCGERGG
jgi:hypothetical protein